MSFFSDIRLPDDNYTYTFISGKCLREKFQICNLEYIKSVCKGRCCESSNSIRVIIHPSELKKIELLGGKVKNGFLISDERGLCYFKGKDHLCKIHDQKPFGCRASPFTVSSKGMIIIRNRNRRLRCYKGDNSFPVYVSHRESLEHLFGYDETERIINNVIAGVDRIKCVMLKDKLDILIDNNENHKNLRRAYEV